MAAHAVRSDGVILALRHGFARPVAGLTLLARKELRVILVGRQERGLSIAQCKDQHEPRQQDNDDNRDSSARAHPLYYSGSVDRYARRLYVLHVMCAPRKRSGF
jgi:hypothetical protein